MSQRSEALEEFYLVAELTLVDDASPKHNRAGWAGIDIDGVKFLLTGAGWTRLGPLRSGWRSGQAQSAQALGEKGHR